jgi:15-cis-phytoene synthase
LLPVSTGIELADPERSLAVAYAPAAKRAGLTALFALDERFGQIVAGTTEPMIGLMRLAWWRETLEKLDAGVPVGEPLLATLAGIGVPGKRLAEIEDGWAAMLDGEMDAEAIARHGRARGASLFRAAATLLGATDSAIEPAGEGWALADLGHRHSDADVRQTARAQARTVLAPLAGKAWSRAGRPLGALAVLAMRDAETAGERRQGSPGRLLRLLGVKLLGR